LANPLREVAAVGDCRAAHGAALGSRCTQGVSGAGGDRVPFPFGDGGEDVRNESTAGGGGVDAYVEGDEGGVGDIGAASFTEPWLTAIEAASRP